MKIPISFDEYEIKSRYIPAIVGAIPLIMLTSTQKETVWLPLFRTASWFLVLENISLAVVSVVLLMSIQRGVAKYCFENNVFNNGIDFPTTTMLLIKNDMLSKEFKRKVRDKIKKDFGICLLDSNEETKNLLEAKCTIKDAVSLIRKQVLKGMLTYQHNIQYGFIRNLIAGGVWALPISVFNSWIFYRSSSVVGLLISVALALFFLAMQMFYKKILISFATTYAEVLFSEYLSLGRPS